jgi:hypothetical protein
MSNKTECKHQWTVWAKYYHDSGEMDEVAQAPTYWRRKCVLCGKVERDEC